MSNATRVPTSAASPLPARDTYTPREAAAKVGCAVITIRRKVNRRELPRVLGLRKMLIPRGPVDAMAAGQPYP